MHWNAGGWFGGQIGATIWILLAGLLTAVRDLTTGLVVVFLFVSANAVGLALWISRKLSCYASTQILVGLSGVCSLATVYILDRANSWELIQTGGQISADSTYYTIGLVYIGLMFMFYLRFGRGRNKPKV